MWVTRSAEAQSRTMAKPILLRGKARHEVRVPMIGKRGAVLRLVPAADQLLVAWQPLGRHDEGNVVFGAANELQSIGDQGKSALIEFIHASTVCAICLIGAPDRAMRRTSATRFLTAVDGSSRRCTKLTRTRGASPAM